MALAASTMWATSGEGPAWCEGPGREWGLVSGVEEELGIWGGALYQGQSGGTWDLGIWLGLARSGFGCGALT